MHTAQSASQILARAKVNLCLRVVNRRPDGLHNIQSLVVFPKIGDYLTFAPAEGLHLQIGGPFADHLANVDDNLVLQAARLMRDFTKSPVGADIKLQKELPVASGIGGGSADAATTLKELAKLWNAKISAEKLHKMGFTLGADIPACLFGKPAWLTGAGENIAPLQSFPSCAMLLVNPGISLSTRTIFTAMSSDDFRPLPSMPRGFASFDELVDWLRMTGNDLQPSAMAQAPILSKILDKISSFVQISQMSGSGATCFGLFPDLPQAERAANILRASEKGWWIASCAIESFG